MNKEQLRARFERNLNGHFDIEKDEDGEYTNFNTVNMFSSFLVGAAVARSEALEEAAVAAWDHYMQACQKFYTSAATQEQWLASGAIRALINKEQAQ